MPSPFLARVAGSGDARALAALLVAVALFFWNVLLGPRVLLPADLLYQVPPWSGLPEAPAHAIPHNALIGDAILQNVAWKNLARASLGRGELPLWNPYEFAGMPFLAGGQSGALYPFGAIFYLLPVERAYGPFLALHIFLAGAFAHLLARVLGARPGAAAIGAFAFAFCGFLIVSFTWPMVVSAAVWLPLLLAVVELIVRAAERGCRPTRPFALALVGSVALASQLLAGHLEISFYAGFSLLFYAVGRLLLGPIRQRAWRRAAVALAALAAMALLGPALAAVQLLPFAELLGQNFRRGFVDLPTVLSYALPRWQAITFVVPDFFGNPSHHGFLSLLDRRWQAVGPNALGQPTDPPGTIWWGSPKNYVEATAYLGILPPLLATVGLLARRSRPGLILAALALVSLALAFGSPLYAVLFVGIPGVDQLHTPFRWIYPYSLAVAILAALGAEAILARAGAWLSRLGWLVALAGGIGVVACVVVALVPAPFVGLAQRVLERSGRLQRAFASGDALLSYEWRNLALAATFVLLAGVAVGLLERRWRLAPAFAAAVVAADLFAIFIGFNTRADPAPIRAVPPAIELLRADREPFRLVGMIDGDALTPLTAMLVGLEDVRGYDTVIPSRFVEFWSLIEPPRGLLYSKLQGLERVESLASPFLRLLNVRYVVAARPIESEQVTEVHRGDMYVYRLRDPIPRAFVVGRAEIAADDRAALAALAAPGFDPRRQVVLTAPSGAATVGVANDAATGATTGTARLATRTPNRLVVDVALDGPGYLVVTDAAFEGWRAVVDGTAAPILRADHIFRAVALEAGAHSVEFQYRPDSVRIGAAISGLAALTVLAGLIGLLAARRLGARSGEGAVRRVARNALSGMGTSLLNKAIDFAFAIAMLRLLQAEGVGRYAFAIAISGYLEILSNFGLNALVIRDGAQRPDRLDVIGGSSLALRLVLWSVGLPVVVLGLLAWGAAFDLATETIAATLLLCLALLPANVAATYSALFYARERVEVPAMLTVATTIVKVALGLTALLAGYGIVGLATVALFGNIGTALALGWLARRLAIAPPLRASRAEARAMVGPAFPLLLNHLLATLFFRIDVLLLQPLRGDRELGYYATAYKFADGLGIIPSTFTFAIFPLLSRLGASSPDGMRRAYALSLKLLLLIGPPLSLIFTALAYPLIGLVGGASYLPDAAIALQLLIWFLPLSFANGLTQYALVAAGQQRLITRAVALALAFNLVANLVSVPTYGYRAAAVVTVLSEVALAVPFWLGIARHIGVSPARCARPFLVAGGLGLVAYLAAERLSSGAAGLAIGLAVQCAVLVALRPLDSWERQRVGELVVRLGRRRPIGRPAEPSPER